MFRVNNNNQLTTLINGEETILPALWLMERCRHESIFDKRSSQRLFNPHQLNDDLSLTDVKINDDQTVSLTFNDNHSETLDLDYLRTELFAKDCIPKPIQWDASDEKIYFSWSQIVNDEAFLHSVVHQYLTHGYVLLTDVPAEKNAIIKVATKFGHIRTTNFGQYFEVYSKKDANDLAYSSAPLDPHTDNPYRQPVPGIQLLHSLINDAGEGGRSTLVDGFAVCERLRGESEEYFQLLTTVPTYFEFIDHNAIIKKERTLISLDNHSEISEIHYSPRLDYIPLMSEEKTKKYHKARKRLGELLSDPEFAISFRLQSGELMMFDNNRVLHGRTGFCTSEGERHLQGCYIDADGPKILYRVLQKQLSAVLVN
jgi:gamma-butyrobetaine dioxygenase